MPAGLELKKSTIDLYHIIATMTMIKSCIVTHRLAVLFSPHLWFPGSNKNSYFAQEIFLCQNIDVHSKRAPKGKGTLGIFLI